MSDEINDVAEVTEQLTVPFAEFAVTRQARLFEAGEYPDKDITVTEDDLEAIASRGGEIPLKVEHGDTVFDGVLGTCGNLVRKGKELWGSLSFTDAAWNLLQTTKHRGLSCGILRDKSGIAEVSLVREPRIASAQVFSEGVVGFTSDVPWTYATDGAMTKSEEVITMPDEVIKKTTDNISIEQALAVLAAHQPDSEAARVAFSATNEMAMAVAQSQEELKRTALTVQATMREMQKLATNNTIAQFKREGKITPAAEPYARAILNMRPLSTASALETECVTFSDKDGNETMVHFAEAFAEFLRVMPAAVNFGELARMAADEQDELTAAQREMNAKLGVSDEAFKQFSRKNVSEEVI